MRSIPPGLVATFAATLLAIGTAVAQTPTQTPAPAANTPAVTTTTVPPTADNNAVERPNTAAPVTPMTNTSAPASRHGENAAVNTSGVNTAAPAPGANSFTQNQARKRLTKGGFTEISTLKKDNQGIWRGTAQKDGKPVSVWVDYRGDAGQQ